MEIRSPFMLPEDKLHPTDLAPYILRNIKLHGNRVALVDAHTGWSCTYDKIEHYVDQFCVYFRRYGINSNSRVAILSLNCPEIILTQLAANLLGVDLIHASPLATTEELVHNLSISHCTCILVHPDFREKLDQIMPKVATCKNVISLPEQGSLRAPVTEPIRDSTLSNSHGLVRSNRMVFFSSGTTGLPKAFEVPCALLPVCVELTSASPWLPPKSTMSEQKQESTLFVIPLTHVYGVGFAFYALCNGHILVTQPRFVPDKFLHALEKYQITYLVMVPPLVNFLANDSLVDKYDLSHLHSITCASAPLPVAAAIKCKERLRLKDMRQLYGMTETRSSTWMPYGHFNCESIGILLPGVAAKFIDPETQKVVCKPYEEGEMWVSGPQIGGTYFNNERATKEAFIMENGVLWCRTGDMGYFDHLGHIYLTDRFKDIIKCKGYQVAPSEIESILFQHPDVADCAVVGKPDDKAGEVPIAFVKLKQGRHLDAQVLKDLVKSRLSSYKQLTGGVIFVDELPRSDIGKILKRQLRAFMTKQQTTSKL